MLTLRGQCTAFLSYLDRNSILRSGTPVADLEDFVVSEIGRAADSRLEESLPLCVYFNNKADRKAFVQAIMDAKPGMISRTWPRDA